MIHGCDSKVDLPKEADVFDLAIVQQSFVSEEHHLYDLYNMEGNHIEMSEPSD